MLSQKEYEEECQKLQMEIYTNTQYSSNPRKYCPDHLTLEQFFGCCQSKLRDAQSKLSAWRKEQARHYGGPLVSWEKTSASEKAEPVAKRASNKKIRERLISKPDIVSCLVMVDCAKKSFKSPAKIKETQECDTDSDCATVIWKEPRNRGRSEYEKRVSVRSCMSDFSVLTLESVSDPEIVQHLEKMNNLRSRICKLEEKNGKVTSRLSKEFNKSKASFDPKVAAALTRRAKKIVQDIEWLEEDFGQMTNELMNINF